MALLMGLFSPLIWSQQLQDIGQTSQKSPSVDLQLQAALQNIKYHKPIWDNSTPSGVRMSL